MESRLDRRIAFEDIVHELREWLEVREYAPGDTVVTMGAPQNGLQLMLMGRASVYDAEGRQSPPVRTGRRYRGSRPSRNMRPRSPRSPRNSAAHWC